MKFGRTFAALAVAILIAGPVQAADHIKIGILGGDSELIWQQVKKIAAKDGLDIEAIPFTDYTIPNAALDAGDLDANAFQHKPYLENQIKTRGYKITAIAPTTISPIGLYSHKVKKLADLKDGALVGIPNDPSNGGRALLLLQAQKLVTLKPGTGVTPTVLDITDNPKHFKFKEVDAAQLVRSLDDLDAAVINSNYVTPAGINPVRDSLAIEVPENNPYGNVIAVRTADKDKPIYKKLVAAFDNDEIRSFINSHFDGAMIPAF